MGPVEDADPAPAGQRSMVAPEEIVVELLRRRLLEAADGHALRVDTAHHVLDRAVLARGVESLEHDQQAECFLGGQPVLIVGQKPYALFEQGAGLRARHRSRAGRIMITSQLTVLSGAIRSGSM